MSKLLQQLEDLIEDGLESKSAPAARSLKLTVVDISFADTVDVFRQSENEILRKELHKLYSIVAAKKGSLNGNTASMLKEVSVETPRP